LAISKGEKKRNIVPESLLKKKKLRAAPPNFSQGRRIVRKPPQELSQQNVTKKNCVPVAIKRPQPPGKAISIENSAGLVEGGCND